MICVFHHFECSRLLVSDAGSAPVPDRMFMYKYSASAAPFPPQRTRTNTTLIKTERSIFWNKVKITSSSPELSDLEINGVFLDFGLDLGRLFLFYLFGLPKTVTSMMR